VKERLDEASLLLKTSSALVDDFKYVLMSHTIRPQRVSGDYAESAADVLDVPRNRLPRQIHLYVEALGGKCHPVSRSCSAHEDLCLSA
jgi:hypothetical protein